MEQIIPYIDRVHQALSDNINGFNKTPDEFKVAMKSPEYVANVHAALGDNLNGFDKSLEQFHDNTIQPNPNGIKVPAKQFFADYMNSPIYKSRLSNLNNKDKPDVKNLINTPITYNNGQGSKTDFGRIIDNTGTHIYPGTSKINIDPSAVLRANKFYGVDGNVDNTTAHELSHGSRVLTPKEELLIASLNKNKTDNQLYTDYKKSKSNGTISDFIGTNYESNVASHDAKPDEIKADLDSFRYQMKKKGIYDTSKRDMTLDDFNKASKDSEINKSLEFKRLMDRFKPSDILLLNNKIATNQIYDTIPNIV